MHLWLYAPKQDPEFEGKGKSQGSEGTGNGPDGLPEILKFKPSCIMSSQMKIELNFTAMGSLWSIARSLCDGLRNYAFIISLSKVKMFKATPQAWQEWPKFDTFKTC